MYTGHKFFASNCLLCPISPNLIYYKTAIFLFVMLMMPTNSRLIENFTSFFIIFTAKSGSEAVPKAKHSRLQTAGGLGVPVICLGSRFPVHFLVKTEV